MDLAVYKQHIKKMHHMLGIPESYATDYALPFHIEEQDLIEIGKNIYGKPQLAFSKTANKWHEIRDLAKKDNVDLFIVSAFRSAEYQANIIHRKLEKNFKLSDILKVNTAPGYSEHHTGRALDITTTGIDSLSENFDQTIAFEWLQQHGRNYGFSLSYPKNIKNKIAYEPWHWACL